MVGAALSRECIAHECAPSEIANMSGYKVSSQFLSGILDFCGQANKSIFSSREKNNQRKNPISSQMRGRGFHPFPSRSTN
jgi:hypothetical protein